MQRTTLIHFLMHAVNLYFFLFDDIFCKIKKNYYLNIRRHDVVHQHDLGACTLIKPDSLPKLGQEVCRVVFLRGISQVRLILFRCDDWLLMLDYY